MTCFCKAALDRPVRTTHLQRPQVLWAPWYLHTNGRNHVRFGMHGRLRFQDFVLFFYDGSELVIISRRTWHEAFWPLHRRFRAATDVFAP